MRGRWPRRPPLSARGGGQQPPLTEDGGRAPGEGHGAEGAVHILLRLGTPTIRKEVSEGSSSGVMIPH